MDDDSTKPRAPCERRSRQPAGRRKLDSYSQDELDARIALLEAEIARVARHRAKASAHRSAADALFKPKTD
jgi:uncharacterized small protein (DUF1192 family)